MTDSLRHALIRPITIVLVATLVLAVLPATAAALPATADIAPMQTWDDGHMTGWGIWGWGMMLFGGLWMVLIVALPIYLVYRLAMRDGAAESGNDRALEVLREQYARGEIDEDEFDHRRSRLS